MATVAAGKLQAEEGVIVATTSMRNIVLMAIMLGMVLIIIPSLGLAANFPSLFAETSPGRPTAMKFLAWASLVFLMAVPFMCWYVLRTMRQSSLALKKLLSRSETELTFSTQGLPLIDERVVKGMFIAQLVMLAVMLIVILVSLFLPREPGQPPFNPVLPWIIFQGLFFRSISHTERLRCMTTGLAWDRADMTTFIPWHVVRRWDIRQGRLSPHVVLGVDKKHGHIEYYTITLNKLDQAQIDQLRESLTVHCPIGHQPATAHPAVVGSP